MNDKFDFACCPLGGRVREESKEGSSLRRFPIFALAFVSGVALEPDLENCP